MDGVNPTILKTTIEAIPVLTEENFASWRTRITALFKLGGIKDNMLNGQPELEEDDNTILCAIILSKLSTVTQSNVVNSENEDNAQLLWKAILKRFISSEPSNRARVYNQFANIKFDISNIEKFVTDVRSAIVKMEDVGIKLDEDIVTYDLLRRLPNSLDNIKQSITHSKNGEDIKPEALLDHLEIHLNELKVSAGSKSETIGTTMFTSEEQRCTPGQHNPFSKTHTRDKYEAESGVINTSCGMINHFSISKNNEIILEGRYHNNLPVLEFEPINHQCHLSSAELLHKSLGHVSYCRLRRKLGVPIKASETCKSCAVVKITKASFHHRSSSASKPFEELHLDLIGPISPMSYKQHKYILTIVDSNTRFVAAIAITSKSNVFATLTYAIDVEAKRLGYYPSVLHSDRGTEFTNQELSDYCRNPVAVLSNQKKSKLEPRGDFGKLIGLNAELKSYRIRLDDGRIVNSKNVKFLDFPSEPTTSIDFGELTIEQPEKNPNPSLASNPQTESPEESEPSIKEEEEETEDSISIEESNGESTDDNEDIVDLLIPESDAPVGRILRDRTLQTTTSGKINSRNHQNF
ncbi:hypothetical protein VP01_158g13 [Puccinia sorghi]|uniref:Integrase catalytic domain-containing protein n=1 Tax=Puccinia sorghi TaxID=27349 RepID=A0A0L6VHQ3_9BASI|nr:hypothetical protein VP01_158g13 [Puccinia sorghi]